MPPPRASNDDIMRVLWQLEAKLDAVTDRMDRGDDLSKEERRAAHESRAVIHKRLDEQVDKINSVQTKIEIHGQIEAQLRDNIKGLKATVEADISPTVDEWKRMKTLGVGISGLIALAGLTVGGIVAYIGDGAVAAIRHWLKIN